MMRMSESVAVEQGAGIEVDPELDDEDRGQRDVLPEGVEVFRINGPFFFGVAGELLDTLRRVGRRPRAVILRMRLVPFLDASGLAAVAEFVKQAEISGARVILSGVQRQPLDMLERADLGPQSGKIEYAADYPAAIRLAES